MKAAESSYLEFITPFSFSKLEGKIWGHILWGLKTQCRYTWFTSLHEKLFGVSIFPENNWSLQGHIPYPEWAMVDIQRKWPHRIEAWLTAPI